MVVGHPIVEVAGVAVAAVAEAAAVVAAAAVAVAAVAAAAVVVVVEVEVDVGACSEAVPGRQASVGVSVVEVETGGSSMHDAVCLGAMSRWIVLNETRRKKTHETASRTTLKSFACGLWVAETSRRTPTSSPRCGLLVGSSSLSGAVPPTIYYLARPLIS